MQRFDRILFSTLVLATAFSPLLLAQADWELLGTRKVSLAKETDVIDVTRRDGRINALRIEVEDGPLEMYNIRIEFANGENFSPETRITFGENDRTRVIDLPGNARSIERIVFRYKGPLRLGAATVRVYGRQVEEGRSKRPPNQDGWTHIGAREVDFRSDRDVIQVEGRRRFNTILLAVEGADVEITNVRVNFANGEHFDPEVRLLFEENSRSRFIDLPGEARDIRNIQFRYNTIRRGAVNHKAIVHVYGKPRGE
jgi:hypothetical protein